MKRAVRGSLKIQDAKIRHLHTIVQLCRAISSPLRHVSTIINKNSSGDEIANVNFYAVRPEATRIRRNNAK